MEQIYAAHRHYRKEVPKYGERHHAPKKSAAVAEEHKEAEIPEEVDEAVRAEEAERIQATRRAGKIICDNETLCQAILEEVNRTDLYDALGS